MNLLCKKTLILKSIEQLRIVPSTEFYASQIQHDITSIPASRWLTEVEFKFEINVISTTILMVDKQY